MKQHPWWIKERDNPQLGTYYVACGQMSRTAARRYEKPLYGSNRMHQYETEAEYAAEIVSLKKKGERVQ